MNNKQKVTSITSISTSKFIILSVLTFGLYEVWWIYKSWRFFSEKEDLEINSATRTIFSIIFLIPLFRKIKRYTMYIGITKYYSSILLFIGYLITALLANLPDYYWLISLFSFIFLISPFEALNQSIKKDPEYELEILKKFNRKQLVLVIVGSMWWIITVLGIIVSFEKSDNYTIYEINASIQSIKPGEFQP